MQDLIDCTRLSTNSPAAMLAAYGVEACRATVVREVTSVFGAYGIAVDPRHLILIADVMTHLVGGVVWVGRGAGRPGGGQAGGQASAGAHAEHTVTHTHRPHRCCLPQGGYRALNRIGMEACTSPLLKITFETAASFLVSATLHGDIDTLTSPAARIVLGRPVGVGTGSLDLVQNMHARPAQLAC